jgi:carbon-monoxide dehydrogenase small subunit
MPEPTTALHVTCTVNGEHVDADVEARTNLADFLREHLGLTGTHLGCEHGVCGACSVLVDGAAVRSCLMLAAQADGTDVVTIEGLADDGELGPIQQGMHESHGFQCAFCSPGFMMTIAALLERNPDPTSDEIRDEISGNLCRCTGYQSIVAGIERAVQIRRGETS